MKVLITGANGFIGKHLLGTFCQNYIDCIAVSRSPFAAEAWWATLNKLTGHLYEPAQKNCLTWQTINDLCDENWETLLQGVDVVIHLAASVHVMDKRLAQNDAHYESCNVDASKQLAKAAMRAGVKQIIYASTIKVHAERTLGQAINEASPCTPADAYARTKLSGENVLKATLANSNTHYTILRFPLVYGPGVTANFKKLIKLAIKGWPLPLATVKNQRSLIAVQNLVDIIQTCCLNPSAQNETFTVADGEDLSTTTLLKHINPALTLYPFPLYILKALAKLCGFSTQADRLFHSLQINIEKTNSVLNWQPVISAADGIKRAVNWHKREGD